MKCARIRHWLVAILGTLCAISGAVAHDSWLIADSDVVSKGEKVWLSFVTGEDFPLGEKATDPARVATFEDLHGEQREQILGYAPEGNGLAIRKRLAGSGLHVIGCALRPNLIELAPEKFKEYLRSERASAAERQFLKDRPATTSQPAAGPVIEEYTKFTKTIIQLEPADPDDTTYSRTLGHRLEIVPLSNPIQWKVGQSVEMRVLLDGHPWADVPISAGREGHAHDHAAASQPAEAKHEHAYSMVTVTNDKGIVRIKLDQAGHWFVKAHLIRPTANMGRAQWESFWASLTFRVKGPRDVAEELRSIRSIHQGLSPAAVAGYRLGHAALKALNLERGSSDLLVVHRCTPEPGYAATADGLQAATGASPGRMNMQLEEATTPDRVEALILNRETGRWLVGRLTPMFLELVRQCPPDRCEALSMETATMAPEDVFELTQLNGPNDYLASKSGREVANKEIASLSR